jgi:hypothetical protein
MVPLVHVRAVEPSAALMVAYRNPDLFSADEFEALAWAVYGDDDAGE